jgi:hypothetical protein
MNNVKISPVISEQPEPVLGLLKVSSLLKTIYRGGEGKEIATFLNVTGDVILRLETGAKKYGSELMTYNGRSADLDLYQELCDSIAYLTQKIFETREVGLALDLMDDVEKIYQIAIKARQRLVQDGILEEEHDESISSDDS